MDYKPRNISGANINIEVTADYNNNQEKQFFQILIQILYFNLQFGGSADYNSTNYNYMNTTLPPSKKLITLKFMSGSPPENGLLPIAKHHSLVWMNNLEFKKSPLYFTETFTAPLWSTFLLFFVVLSLAIWMCQKIVTKFKFINFNLVSLILRQPMTSNETNNGLATKLILFVFGLLLVLFYSAYSAFIDALLAIKKTYVPFGDLAELYKKSDFVICVPLYTDPTAIIKHLKLIDQLNVVQLNTNACPITNPGNGIRNPNINFKCNSQKIVFISGSHTSNCMKIILPHCKLKSLPKKYFESYSTIAVDGKPFQLREQFNFVLLRIYSSGISYYITEILPDKMVQNPKPAFIMNEIVQLAAPISFQQVYLIFMILVVGATLGFILMGLEMVWFKIRK